MTAPTTGTVNRDRDGLPVVWDAPVTVTTVPAPDQHLGRSTPMTAPPATVPEVGAPMSKAVVNAQLGTAAQKFKEGLDGLVNLFEWQEPYTEEMLVGIGFTPEEVTLLKSGLGEVPAIDAAVDATQWLKRFWGAVI